ncbi:PREDICTED: transcription repressor OFP14-like [Camelina sativa]|uniref:Transcription repressor n=1 Tax=Camelina sativa TaxID=90675 RepID=A0ABM0SY04_CAMSA|nr:PREDICTED: transcription repressor OFP14-like [Camelina sativa]
MPNPLQKSLHGYLSKIKRETGKLQLSSSHSFSSSKNWVLGKHPKKLSFSFKHRRRNSKTRFNKDEPVYQDFAHAATLSDIDRFLEENFKSLCIRDDQEVDHADHRLTKNKEKRESPQDTTDDDDDDDDVYRHRFERTWGPAVYDSPKQPPRRIEKLSPPPGTSSEGRPSLETTSTSEERQSRSTLVLPENCIAVLKYSDEPQDDFRLSMVEMMESKLGMREREVDWDLMEELLFCYLDLNDKKSHKFILSAFVDLIIALREKEKRITRKGLVRSLSTLMQDAI